VPSGCRSPMPPTVSRYGGGRDLYDTIQGADIGAGATNFGLDFNFAYNPSCAYEDRWSCPVPPEKAGFRLLLGRGERLPAAGPITSTARFGIMTVLYRGVEQSGSSSGS
jgi:hypothetical protein